MDPLTWLKNNKLQVKGISSDSRQISPGWVFVAIQGEKADGNTHIEECFKKGAIAVLGTVDYKAANSNYFKLRDNEAARQVLAQLSTEFFEHPSHQMLMIGVTGTSGKTSMTYILEALLKTRYKKVGVIGTIEYRLGNTVIPSTHTTPGAFELQKLLRQMKDQGADAVVMEVSSHALKQYRTFGIAFDEMLFTNLTPEHLDYHPDMEDYFGSKAKLFLEYPVFSVRAQKKPVAVINQDCEWGKKLGMLAQAQPLLKIEKVLTKNLLHQSRDGIEGQVYGAEIKSKLTGETNIANILCALAMTKALGFTPQEMTKGMAALQGIPGRLEKIGTQVWVDYAHKPDALQKVLATLKALKSEHSKLICVFGCGGDRDRFKRPIMGKIAYDLADRVIVTSDNPRSEDPNVIISEIVAGMPQNPMEGRFEIVPDRREAIGRAVKSLGKEDLLLVAGKGHEDYQIIKGSDGGLIKVHFDDREVVREFLTANPKNL